MRHTVNFSLFTDLRRCCCCDRGRNYNYNFDDDGRTTDDDDGRTGRTDRGRRRRRDGRRTDAGQDRGRRRRRNGRRTTTTGDGRRRTDGLHFSLILNILIDIGTKILKQKCFGSKTNVFNTHSNFPPAIEFQISCSIRISYSRGCRSFFLIFHIFLIFLISF